MDYPAELAGFDRPQTCSSDSLRDQRRDPENLAARPKLPAPSHDSLGVRMSAVPGRGWVERAAPIVAHAVSWWAAGAVIVVTFGILAYRLLAERARRKTLETTYRYAPAGTVLIQGEGPGGPAMWIEVGEGPRPEQTMAVNGERELRHPVTTWRRG